jgi:hypothetical protein
MKYNVTKTLVDTATWAASSQRQVDLPMEGAITRIVIEYDLTVTGVLAADTNAEFAQHKPIQNLKITGGGGKNYLGAVGDQMGRLLHFLNLKDFPGVSFHKAMATNTVYGCIVLHFGSRPRDMYGRDNPFDLTAFIPAKDESNLKLTWDTTQAADICDTAIDISAGTMRFTVYEVLGLPKLDGMIPVSSTVQYAHSANFSDLGAQFDVPTGQYIRRIALLQQDATAISSGGPLVANDEIGRVGLLLPKENRRLIEIDWEALISEGGIPRVAAMTAAGAVTKPADQNVAGFGVLDMRKYGHPEYGLDLRNYATGDVKLGLTIENYASGDDTIIFYDAVQPYSGR